MLYLQLKQLISLHCGSLETPFEGGSCIQNPARVSKTTFTRLLLCSVVVTSLLRGHGYETVIILGMWSFVGLCLWHLIYVPGSSMWLSRLGLLSRFTPSFPIKLILFTTAPGPWMCATSSRIVASVWSSRQHNSTTPSIWSRHRSQTRNCQITGLPWGGNGCWLRALWQRTHWRRGRRSNFPRAVAVDTPCLTPVTKGMGSDRPFSSNGLKTAFLCHIVARCLSAAHLLVPWKLAFEVVDADPDDRFGDFESMMRLCDSFRPLRRLLPSVCHGFREPSCAR